MCQPRVISTPSVTGARWSCVSRVAWARGRSYAAAFRPPGPAPETPFQATHDVVFGVRPTAPAPHFLVGCTTNPFLTACLRGDPARMGAVDGCNPTGRPCAPGLVHHSQVNEERKMADTYATADLAHELATTRRVLEKLPDEHWAWRPHEKSFTLGELSTHIVNIPTWMQTVLSQSEFDLATVPMKGEVLPNRDAVLAKFDEGVREVEAALPSLTAENMGETWTLRRGDQVVFQQPRALALRALGTSHLIHHRAQLGVYLRLLDVPVPGMYGPSADELGG